MDFIKEFAEACYYHDINRIVQLVEEPIFKSWFNLITQSGSSNTDEWFAYNGATDFDKEIGKRISYLGLLSTEADEKIENTTGNFPTIYESFKYQDKKYWVVTMVGQGAESSIFTDEEFQKCIWEAYGSKT